MTARPAAGRVIRDGFALAVGTLTALPVRGPRTVDTSRAGVAMSIAPLAVLPAGGLVAAVAVGTDWIALSPLVTAALVVTASALVTRALHIDGLADTADGLTGSYDRERSLAIMRTGDVGPAGTVAVVLVLAIQIFAAARVLEHDAGWAAVAIAWCCGRVALPVMCVRGVASARPDGLGATVAGAVPAIALTVVLAATTGAMVGAVLLLDRPWWQGAVAIAVALLMVTALIRRCRSRIGGITGDTLGAGVEICAAVLLVGLSAA